MASVIKSTDLHRFLPEIIEAIPVEWKGTTFNNSNLLSRAGFAEKLATLISDKAANDGHITSDDLLALGNAEDYLRVSSNISSTLEVVLGVSKGYDVSRVFTFSSPTMAFIAVGLTTALPVNVYTGSEHPPFTEADLKELALIGCELHMHDGEPKEHQGEIVLSLESALKQETPAFVDGVVAPNVLYISNTDKIDESKILVIRKRMNTPVTTPVALQLLKDLAGVDSGSHDLPCDDEISAFNQHLQQLSGVDIDPDTAPVVCTAGLPTLCSLWVTLVGKGGADILMCSTAYGGSSQLVDVLTGTTHTLQKHTFHIQGTRSIVESIQRSLKDLAKDSDKLHPTVVLFVEMPTNPDMKVPDLSEIADALQKFKNETEKEVLLLVDATFAPNSQVLSKVKELVPYLPAFVFLSLSKSVSRGHTTAGTLISNHTERAKSLLHDVRKTAQMLGTTATNDQMTILCQNHRGVEERCIKAYGVAASVGQALVDAVKKVTGKTMPLAFVTPEQAAQGFTTSTFSFNLPSPSGATEEQNAGVAQHFVDLICEHKEFKPCVSFGQDNDLVYATVPATSTQGAIKEEDKALQAVGGVQLVRLSYSPGVDIDAVSAIITNAVTTLYSKY